MAGEATSAFLAAGIGAISATAIVRAVDVVGTNQVVNGTFDTAITPGWTDASSAGGTAAWVSPGRARDTFTTATARLRQAVTVTAGKRQLFYARGYNATANATATLGSTTAGSADLFNKSVQSAIPGVWATQEVLAPTATVQISLNIASAGQIEWDNVKLYDLNPTSFLAGRRFADPIARVDSDDLGLTPDNLPWRQMEPQNAAHRAMKIVGGKFYIDGQNAVGSPGNTLGQSGGYTFLDFGDGKVVEIMADLSWTGATGPACAMISMEPSGVMPTVTGGITTNSVHIVFTDTQVNIERYAGTVKTPESVVYGTPCVRDGRSYRAGWGIVGNVLSIYCPDGTVLTRDATPFIPLLGSCGFLEPFFSAPIAGDIGIGNPSMKLG